MHMVWIIIKVWQKPGCEMERRLRTANDALRLDIFVEIGLDEREPLFDTALDVSSTITNISNHWEWDLLASVPEQLMTMMQTYTVEISTDLHRLHRRFSGLACRAPSHRAERIYLRESTHAESRWSWYDQDGSASQKSRPECRLSSFDRSGHCCLVDGQALSHPSLMS